MTANLSESANHSGRFQQPSLSIYPIIYTVLIALGTIGNAVVIIVVTRVLTVGHKVVHIYVYLLCLSCVDFLFTVAGYFIAAFMFLGDWQFGLLVCKLVYLSEALNKTLSVYLLVVVSADRYLAACHPYSQRFRTVAFARRVLVVLVLTVCATNVPIFVYAKVETFPWGLRKCGLRFPELPGSPGRRLWTNVGHYYTLVLLIFYFLLPAVLILAFYVQVLGKVQSQHRRSQNAVQTHRLTRHASRQIYVTVSIFLAVLFYFLCWTPYWWLQATIMLLPYTTWPLFLVRNFVDVATCIYALPYLNTALNPIFYALLNRALRRAYTHAHHRCVSKRLLQDVEATTWTSRKLRGNPLVSSVRRKSNGIQNRLKPDQTGCNGIRPDSAGFNTASMLASCSCYLHLTGKVFIESQESRDKLSVPGVLQIRCHSASA